MKSITKRQAKQVGAAIDKFIESQESPQDTIKRLKRELKTCQQRLKQFEKALSIFDKDYHEAEKEEGEVILAFFRATLR